MIAWTEACLAGIKPTPAGPIIAMLTLQQRTAKTAYTGTEK